MKLFRFYFIYFLLRPLEIGNIAWLMSIARQLKVHRTKEPWQACPKIWRGGSLVQLALYCNVRAGSSLLWKNSLDENLEFRSRMEKKRYARKQESAGIKFGFTPFLLWSERNTLESYKWISCWNRPKLLSLFLGLGLYLTIVSY